ncbi:hypothetical protein RCL1_008479 [Eukaryota sp. TZLM3-RCL]
MKSPTVLLYTSDDYIVKGLLHFYKDKPQHPSFTTISASPSNSSFATSRFVHNVVDSSSFENIASAAADSNVIVLDIRSDYSSVIPLLDFICSPQCSHESKTLIFISTTLTWARTPKEGEEEDEDAKISEANLAHRRPHIAYRDLFNFEKSIPKLIGKVHSYSIIHAGLIYGLGEGALSSIFNQAYNHESLSLMSVKNNSIAMIHCLDLSRIFDRLFWSSPLPENSANIVAVDKSTVTQSEIFAKISESIGTTLVQPYQGPDLPPLTTPQGNEEIITDIKFETEWVSENIEEDDWHCGEGFIENFDKILTEYFEFNGLSRLSVIIDGPPGSNSKEIALELSEVFGIPAFGPSDLSQNLAEKIEKEEEDEEVEEEKDQNPLKVLKSQLINDTRVFKKGVVLYDLIHNVADFDCLVQKSEEDDEEVQPEKSLTVDYVVKLTGSESWLRASHAKSNDGSSDFNELYSNYFTTRSSETNQIDDCLFDYLQLKGCVLVELNVESLSIPCAIKAFSTSIGRQISCEKYDKVVELPVDDSKAVNNSPSAQESTKMAENIRSESEIALKLKSLDAGAAQLLAVKAQPFQEYLMQSVMPTLSEAIQKVVETRPEDPIEMLASILLSRVELY